MPPVILAYPPVAQNSLIDCLIHFVHHHSKHKTATPYAHEVVELDNLVLTFMITKNSQRFTRSGKKVQGFFKVSHSSVTRRSSA